MALSKHQNQIVLANNEDEEASAETVPDPILEEILSRVPAKTVHRCKTLSKSWLRTLDCPIFARSHFSRAPFCPLVVFGDRSIFRSRRITHPIEVQSVSDVDQRISKSKLMSRIDFNTLEDKPSRIGGRFFRFDANAVSCEGLVCWVLYNHPGDDYIVVCNPVTSEYAFVSASPTDEDNAYVFVGMGFCPATKKFELLRMSGRIEDECDAEVSHWWPELLTVGDRCWRRVGDGMYMPGLGLFRDGISQVVYVNGAIYWSSEGDPTICCFNFDRSTFQVIPLPKMKSLMLEIYGFDSEEMILGVLANSLCVSLVSPDDGHVELWIMENNGVSQVQWSKLCDVDTKTTYLEHNGSKCPRGQYKAIKHLDGGEILMHDWVGKFLIYDPTTKEERHFCVLEDSCLEDLAKDRIDCLEVIPHVPCLVKLMEALNVDEEGVKLMKEEANRQLWRVK